MDTVTIRDRTPADLRRCADLLAEVHRLDGYPLNWPTDPQRWLSPPDLQHAWVAEVGGGPVGHIAVHGAAAPPRPQSAPAEVGRLFVAPAVRGHGVAGALLRRARRWATDRDRELLLEVVDRPGSTAVALYERTGWRHTRTSTADWTAPDGSPVTLRHYALPRPHRA
ncbi:GNAT family N-acetyltransferase [Micromonospora sp. NPDC051006]|uniref:GNAT family N-acetyltransferase n=1 Tax=Micromonospora sp. NPDC051006 TaxID=3364283 RepID=UPI00379C3213